MVTQHVKNIGTQKTIQHGKELEDQDNAEGQEESQDHRDERPGTSRSTGWTRDRHVTRSISKKSDESNAETKGEEDQDIVSIVTEPDARNYGEAVRSTSKDKWRVAMTEELNALESNGVCTVVVPPENSHVLHNKWVFKTKTDADGNVERYKASLVVCGNEQLFGIDYTLTFAAVIELGTVKVILVLSRRWNVPARHVDVSNAYVKAEKEKDLDIYMKVPSGMQVSQDILDEHGVKHPKHLALLLKKSLYGLKQAGR